MGRGKGKGGAEMSAGTGREGVLIGVWTDCFGLGQRVYLWGCGGGGKEWGRGGRFWCAISLSSSSSPLLTVSSLPEVSSCTHGAWFGAEDFSRGCCLL